MKARIAILFLVGLALQGCISMHSYVDPQYHHAGFSDLNRVEPPYSLQVKVQFQRNGEEKPKVERSLQDAVVRTLRASGVAVPYEGKGTVEGDLYVVLNNIADMGNAAGKGFGTGLTFGLVGSHVQDNYEMTARLTMGGVIDEKKYPHVIMSTVGNASGPPGLPPVALTTAFNQVVDDLLLNFLKDEQSNGRLIARAGTK